MLIVVESRWTSGAGFQNRRSWLSPLDLGQAWGACALHDAGDAGAGDVDRDGRPAAPARGIVHLTQPVLPHIEHANLVGGAIAVFDSTQDAGGSSGGRPSK